MKKHTLETMISAEEIQTRIKALGQQISQDYANSQNELILVGLLRGSFIFMADLSRSITVGHEVDFMTASSYGNAVVSNRDVKILKDLDEVMAILKLRHSRSIEICTLLDKPSRREVAVPVKYIGFSIPDEFVVGYGIDYAQHYRHLPYIGHVTLLES